MGSSDSADATDILTKVVFSAMQPLSERVQGAVGDRLSRMQAAIREA